MANSFRKFFGLVFPGFQPPPRPKSSRPKFTPKLVGIPLQFLLSRTQKVFAPILWLRGRRGSFHAESFRSELLRNSLRKRPKFEEVLSEEVPSVGGRMGWPPKRVAPQAFLEPGMIPLEEESNWVKVTQDLRTQKSLE